MLGDNEAKLATAYETLRRREYELINDLLEVLPKIDSLEQERVAQVRDALFHADHPYLMVFVGPFSSGKSSLINALLGERDVLPVGPVPTTDRITILRWGEQPDRIRSGEVDTVFYPSPLLQKVSFVDTPGLESVFKEHEETTRRFLHRADTVLLVMLATQAMTQRTMDYLRQLREFGKSIIVVINQADLLTPEERDKVRDHVLDQSQAQLGFKPEVWLVSAREGLAARAGSELDAAAWDASGLSKIEDYVDEQLGDVQRLRQKLQTPLQIVRNVHDAALQAVRGNQAALDHYQNIADNIDQQLAGQHREQQKIVREVMDEVSEKFGDVAGRGSEAVRDMFRFSRAFGGVVRGLLELVGLGGMARRMGGGSYTRPVFEAHGAFAPTYELATVSGKLGPRLEGKDVQDVEDLVKYARREIEALPPAIQEKVIGAVQVPLHYDRSALQSARDDLEAIAAEAREVETDNLERTVRNTLLYLGAWEFILVILLFFLFNAWDAVGNDQPTLPIILLVVLLALALGGLLFLPLRGRALESAYTQRILQLQGRYNDTLARAAEKQMEYSMNLRRQAIQPLTRLIEAQTQIHTEQLKRLQAAGNEMSRIETDLSRLGKNRLVGMRG